MDLPYYVLHTLLSTMCNADMHCMACLATFTFFSFYLDIVLTLRFLLHIAMCVYIRHIIHLYTRFTCCIHVSMTDIQPKQPLVVCWWQVALKLLDCVFLVFLHGVRYL